MSRTPSCLSNPLTAADIQRLRELHDALPPNPGNVILLNTIIEILESYDAPIISEMITEITSDMLETVMASIPEDYCFTNRKIMHMVVTEFLCDIYVAAFKHRETEDNALPEGQVRIQLETLVPGQIMCYVVPIAVAKATFRMNSNYEANIEFERAFPHMNKKEGKRRNKRNGSRK